MADPLDSTLDKAKKKSPEELLAELEKSGKISSRDANDFRSSFAAAAAQRDTLDSFAGIQQALGNVSAVLSGISTQIPGRQDPANPGVPPQKVDPLTGYLSNHPGPAHRELEGAGGGITLPGRDALYVRETTPGRVGYRNVERIDLRDSRGITKDAVWKDMFAPRALPVGGTRPSSASVAGSGTTFQSRSVARVAEPQGPPTLSRTSGQTVLSSSFGGPGNANISKSFNSAGQFTGSSIQSQYGTASLTVPGSVLARRQQTPDEIARARLFSLPTYPLASLR